MQQYLVRVSGPHAYHPLLIEAITGPVQGKQPKPPYTRLCSTGCPAYRLPYTSTKWHRPRSGRFARCRSRSRYCSWCRCHQGWWDNTPTGGSPHSCCCRTDPCDGRHHWCIGWPRRIGPKDRVAEVGGGAVVGQSQTGKQPARAVPPRMPPMRRRAWRRVVEVARALVTSSKIFSFICVPSFCVCGKTFSVTVNTQHIAGRALL